ncbi:mechanosensitive ion channel protein 2, chloroplastic-like [Hordeum vulgare]|nr:mechanosensitive ion channel protein 2, chloroplastic-like [Hordeum vulgare]
MASAPDAFTSTNLGSQSRQDEDLGDFFEKLDLREDEFDDVIVEEEAPELADEIPWLALARVQTNKNFSQAAFFKDMRAAWNTAKPGQDSLVYNSHRRNYMPMLYVPYRYRASRVRSFALPVALKEIPLVKSASSVLTRSCGTLLANPATPLVHGGNWKKSPTYLISTSYLQPLLLWTGATLICRGLDPVVLPSAASQAVKTCLLTFHNGAIVRHRRVRELLSLSSLHVSLSTSLALQQESAEAKSSGPDNMEHLKRIAEEMQKQVAAASVIQPKEENDLEFGCIM